MVFFRIDDGWHNHPKVVAAGNAAAGLWARCGSYCGHYNLEGRVPKAIARGYGTRTEIAKLLSVGLWVDGGDVYLMRDWCDYNDSADEVAAKKAARARAGRLGGLRSGESRRSNSEANASANAPPVVEANGEAKSNPRPDQTLSTYISTVTDDDYRLSAASSVVVEEIIQLAAKALALEDRPHPKQGFVNGIAKNLRNEQMPTVLNAITEGITHEQAAQRLGANTWYIRKAQRGNDEAS